MVHVTTYLLACTMFLVNVMGKGVKLPLVSNGYAMQCQARSSEYVGACISQNLDSSLGSGFTCGTLWCAKYVSPGEYEAVDHGLVSEGTECAKYRVCLRGECVYVGKDRVPPQIGPGPQFACRTSMYRALAAHPQGTTGTSTTTPPPTRKSVIISPKKDKNKNKRTH